MKKRILSLILASSMLIVSSMAAFAAQPLITDDPGDFYEGNKPFELAEKILDELNEDKEAGLFDNSEHVAQLDTIIDMDITSITAATIDDTIEWYLDYHMTDYRRQYLVALVRAYGSEDNDEIKVDLKNNENDTTEKSLRESFGMLNEYVNDMKALFIEHNIRPEHYDAIEEEAKEYVAEPLIAILKVMFAENKDDMRTSYYNDFLRDDRAKKTLSVLFGAELTGEIVNDNFLDEDDSGIGIVHHVKDYILANTNNNSVITEIKAELGRVMDEDKDDAVNAAFDFLGKIVSKAYDYDASADADLKNDVKMLMGDGNTEGLIEKMINEVDNADLDTSNIWLNLFLSEFVQLNLVTGPLNTECADGAEPKELRDNANVTFKTENLTDYGIGATTIPLNTGWFDVVCYVEGETPDTFDVITDHVTYSDGKIQITKDNEKGETYSAYLVLYRDSRDGDVSTFIESYPVTVINKSGSTGGGGTTRYSVKFETNGGEALGSAYYVKGATVQLTKVPVREGYIFDGWYSDAALTQKVESIVMDGNITVYAKWIKDGSAVVSTVDIPEILEGEHHYAYIMGYPDGDIRPMGNITRAETVTMIFRLLKDSVRTANLTEVNGFSDVDENDWYNTAVSTLAGLGIVEGRTKTEFMPDAYITRAEFATLFARLAQFDVVAENKYGDVDNHWAEEHIHEASAYGWIAGYEDDTFRPDKAINRAEAMTLVNRVLKRVPQSKDDLLEGMTIWTDNKDTSAWYYIAVQEATNSHDYERKNKSYETWTKLTENRDWTTYEK